MSARATRRSRPAGFTLIELLVAIFLLAVLSAFAYGTLSYVQKAREATQTRFARSREVEGAVHQLVTDFEQLSPRPVRQPLGTDYLAALVADTRNAELVSFTRAGWSNSAGLPRGTLQRVSYTFDKDRGVLVRAYTSVLDAPLSATPIKRDLVTDVVNIAIRYLPPNGQLTGPAASPAAQTPQGGTANAATAAQNAASQAAALSSPPPLTDSSNWSTIWPPLNATLPATITPTPPAQNQTNTNQTSKNQNGAQGQPGPTATALPRTRPVAVEITLELKDYGKIVRLVEVPG